jgi:hypothetical protein
VKPLLLILHSVRQKQASWSMPNLIYRIQYRYRRLLRWGCSGHNNTTLSSLRNSFLDLAPVPAPTKELAGREV